MDRHDLEILRRAPLFTGMPQATLQALLQGSEPRPYPKGRLLFQQGEPATRFYVILDGWVKIFRASPLGDEAVFGVFSAGQTFAEAAAFMQHDYPASAEVVEDARLLPISSDGFRARLLGEPEICLSMVAAMSRRLHMMVGQIEQLQTRSSAQRLAQFLVAMAPVRDGSAVLVLPYDKSLIAARLGMKPESLSRAFGRLRGVGVGSEGNRVTLEDVAALSEFGERGPLRSRSAGS